MPLWWRLGVGAMDDPIHIQYGDFRADIYLERIPEMLLPKFCKLLRLMRSAPDENRIAINVLEDYLRRLVVSTRNGAKPAHTKANKLQTIYNKEILFYGYHNQ